MKRVIILVVLSCSFLVSIAQESKLFIGVGSRLEKSFYQNEDFLPETVTYISINREHYINKTILGYGVSYFHKNLTTDSYWGGNIGSRYSSERFSYFSSADIFYQYLGFNGSLGGLVLTKNKFRLKWTGFCHLDVLINEKESNHSEFGSRIYSSNFEGNSTSSITYYPESLEEFDAVTLKEGCIFLGTNFSPEVELWNFLVSPYYAVGIVSGWRIKDNKSDGRNEYLNEEVKYKAKFFQEFGLRVGYVFKKT